MTISAVDRQLKNFSDDAAMARAGRESTLRRARSDALQDLRDWCTRINSAEWADIGPITDHVSETLLKLRAMAVLAAGIDGNTP